MYYTVIKQSGHLTEKHSKNVENTRLWLVFSTFLSCSQMPAVVYLSVIHGLGISSCEILPDVIYSDVVGLQ